MDEIIKRLGGTMLTGVRLLEAGSKLQMLFNLNHEMSDYEPDAILEIRSEIEGGPLRINVIDIRKGWITK